MTKLKENLKSFVYSIPSGRLSSGVAVMRRIWLPQSVPEMQCGTPLYDDFSKLTPENLNALRKQLALNERGSGGTTPSSVSEPIRPRTKGIWDSISQRFLPRRVPSEQSSIELGIRHDMNSPESILQVEDRQILLCIDIGEENMARLHQPSLSKAKVSNDEQLFAFLRNQYWKHRTTPRLFTLRCVKRVWITKFDVDKHNLVELAHPRDRTCKPECMCLPPLDRIKTTEYVCSPAPEKEPQQHPAYSPRRLKHYLEKPHQFETAEKDIYQQLPKRKSQLSVGESKPCLAWGLHFEEDWHWPTIYIYVSVSIFGSLLFGIIWSVTMKGVGDGFTAGSFGVSDCSVLLALAAWRSTSF
ncbi:hypothetical protein F4803DRAFT_102615 [Xylaria telfairii]|nr:hypothetical protein F4803DRAFT_102615 [Xylaria telfairii]